MILSFLIDSRYGGPQMINNHIKKNVLKHNETIFLDKKNKKFGFLNLRKRLKVFFSVDVIFNLLILIKNQNYFSKYNIFFVYSVVNIIPVIFGIYLKKKIIWYILEQPSTFFYFTFKLLNYFYNIQVICISDSLGKQLKLKQYNIYFPSINTNYWKSKKRVRNKYLEITCVGNFNKTKNHYQLINFLKNSKINFNLNLIGKKLDTQKMYFKKLITQIKHINYSTPNKIKVFQNKKAKFIKKILNKTDIYILPSLSEGLSISLIEAMSMEKICLVSKKSNHSKTILHNKNGFEFKLELKSFLKILNSSLSLSKIKRKKITKKARETVVKIINQNLKFEKKLKINLLKSL